MTPEQEATDVAEQDDEQTDHGTPAQTVRVPNVTANAKSGLDHTVIGANALEPADDDQDGAGESEDDLSDQVPKDDQDAALAWVRDAEDRDTARQRADAVWAAYAHDGGDTNPDNDALGKGLRDAVYQPAQQQEDLVVPAGLEGEALEAWVSGDAVEGDEQNNPERHAAYLARRKAAGLDGPATEDSAQGDGQS